jgi:hypothetical protein
MTALPVLSHVTQTCPQSSLDSHMSEIQPLSMASEPCCSDNCPCKEQNEPKMSKNG